MNKKAVSAVLLAGAISVAMVVPAEAGSSKVVQSNIKHPKNENGQIMVVKERVLNPNTDKYETKTKVFVVSNYGKNEVRGSESSTLKSKDGRKIKFSGKTYNEKQYGKNGKLNFSTNYVELSKYSYL